MRRDFSLWAVSFRALALCAGATALFASAAQAAQPLAGSDLSKISVAALGFCPTAFWREAWHAPSTPPTGAAAGAAALAEPCWGATRADSPSARALADAQAFLKAQQASGSAGSQDGSAADASEATPQPSAYSQGSDAPISPLPGAAPRAAFLSAAFLSVADAPTATTAAKPRGSKKTRVAALDKKPSPRVEQRQIYDRLERALASDPAAKGPLRAAMLAACAELAVAWIPGSENQTQSRLDEAEAIAQADEEKWRENPSYWPFVAQLESDRISAIEARADQPGAYDRAQAQMASSRAKINHLFQMHGEAPRSYQAQALWSFDKENFAWAIHPSSQQPYAAQSKAFEKMVSSLTTWKLAAGSEDIFWGDKSARAPAHAPLSQAESEGAALLVLRQTWELLPAEKRARAAQCSLGWTDDDQGCDAVTQTLLMAAKTLRERAAAQANADTTPSADSDDASETPDETQEESFLKPDAR